MWWMMSNFSCAFISYAAWTSYLVHKNEPKCYALICENVIVIEHLFITKFTYHIRQSTKVCCWNSWRKNQIGTCWITWKMTSGRCCCILQLYAITIFHAVMHCCCILRWMQLRHLLIMYHCVMTCVFDECIVLVMIYTVFQKKYTTEPSTIILTVLVQFK